MLPGHDCEQLQTAEDLGQRGEQERQTQQEGNEQACSHLAEAR